MTVSTVDLDILKRSFDFTDRLKNRLAMTAIGRSTLRGQGAPGMVECARKFLRRLDLRPLLKPVKFDAWLNRQTVKLARAFPGDGNGNWGAARKSLNIFLRDAFYCRPLCDHFALEHLEPLLEVPLDSHVYAGIAADMDALAALPPWPGVKHLSPKISRDLQACAATVALSFGVARVHLDVRYWRRDALDELASD